MGTLNEVILIGTVGRDAEVLYTQNGFKLLKFSLATNKWDSKTKENTAEWHNIVYFYKDSSSDFYDNISKGEKLLAKGRISYNSFKNENEQFARTYTNIEANSIMRLNSPKKENDTQEEQTSNQKTTYQEQNFLQNKDAEIEEAPF